MTSTKYIIERNGDTQKFEVPDSAVLTVTPVPAAQDKTELTVYTAIFSIDGAVVGMFSCVGAVYQESMEPVKKTWIEK